MENEIYTTFRSSHEATQNLQKLKESERNLQKCASMAYKFTQEEEDRNQKKKKKKKKKIERRRRRKRWRRLERCVFGFRPETKESQEELKKNIVG